MALALDLISCRTGKTDLDADTISRDNVSSVGRRAPYDVIRRVDEDPDRDGRRDSAIEISSDIIALDQVITIRS